MRTVGTVSSPPVTDRTKSCSGRVLPDVDLLHCYASPLQLGSKSPAIGAARPPVDGHPWKTRYHTPYNAGQPPILPAGGKSGAGGASGVTRADLEASEPLRAVCKHLRGPILGGVCVPSIHLSLEQRHLAWDNSLDPVVMVGPGDELTLDLADASGGQIDRNDDASAIARLDFSAINPCTGPVFIEGVAAGDDVVVEILEIATEGWAWTANIPGFGLLGEDFPDRVCGSPRCATESSRPQSAWKYPRAR